MNGTQSRAKFLAEHLGNVVETPTGLKTLPQLHSDGNVVVCDMFDYEKQEIFDAKQIIIPGYFMRDK